MAAKYPSVPQPMASVESLQASVLALKELVEIISQQKRGSKVHAAVTFQDLVDLGLIAPDEIPG